VSGVEKVSTMAKTKILVVDDDDRVLQMLKIGLEKSGPYEVLAEGDPKLAKGAAQDFRPDVIILDVIMPEMDGGAVASEIRQDNSMRDVPIIFLTGILEQNEAAMRGGKLGSDPVIAKPVDIHTLIERIEKCLAKRSRP